MTSQPASQQPPLPRFSASQQFDSHQQELFSNYFLLAPPKGSSSTPSGNQQQNNHLNGTSNTNTNGTEAIPSLIQDGSSAHYAQDLQQQPPIPPYQPFQQHPHHHQSHQQGYFNNIQHTHQQQQQISQTSDAPQLEQNHQEPPPHPAPETPTSTTPPSTANKVEAGTSDWHKQKKETHKEVERRRRDVISNGIDTLADMIPYAEKKKGKVVQAAAMYIRELKEAEEERVQRWGLEKVLAEQAIQELSNTVHHLSAENMALLERLNMVRASGAPKRQYSQQQQQQQQHIMNPDISKKRKM
ncbi:basic helix-loop-helix protein [Rhizoclosmatium sp. JEL0117]|nr:basic helix-loop-helix protein [Rhizoclosmatium sp. JEL0117]